MQNKKYICPQCGSKMESVYEKPALNLSCPKCGCKIASSKWDEIDLDENKYEIFINPEINPKIEQLKLCSKLLGKNFIFCKEFIIKGGKIFEGNAKEILQTKLLLEEACIKYSIKPDFKY